MSTQAKRIGGYADLGDFVGEMCYFRDGGIWYLYLPYCGLGNLANHTVTEHEDGTITVQPSIKTTGHDSGKRTVRHGYLTRGVWEPCADSEEPNR